MNLHKILIATMSTQTKRTYLLAMISVSLLWLASGCASTGREQSASTSSHLQKVQGALATVANHTDAALAALDQLSRQTTPEDLAQAYRQYSRQVDDLIDSSNSLRSRGQDMREAAQDYFADWDKEIATIQNTRIRQSSQNRRSELVNHYHQFTTGIAETRAAFDPLISDLRDIQKHLDLDLTSSGIQAIKPSIDNAFAHGAAVKKRLNGLIQEAYQLNADLYPETGAS